MGNVEPEWVSVAAAGRGGGGGGGMHVGVEHVIGIYGSGAVPDARGLIKTV